MKTLKLMLAAMFIMFAVASVAGTDPGPKNKKAVKISLRKAIHNPGLSKAIFAQVDPEKLVSTNQFYTARVVYQHTTYYVSGTRAQWKRFLKLGIKPPASNYAFKLGIE